ncbi:MAG TPA: nicotinate (nicotinamide) nucleotide adenylyltransferase [Parasegetibacter sp.]
MKVGLYFGSFNPIHIGHLIIASFMENSTDLDQVWFVVSPQNPLKPSAVLLNEYHRLHLVRAAVEDNDRLKVSDIEFHLPKPSYTIDTLAYLHERHPQHEFSIILGSDGYQNLCRWKNGDLLAERYKMYVYRRKGFDVSPTPNATIVDAPLLDISSTLIRQWIKEGKSIRYLVPDAVRREIEINRYYK